MICPSGKAKCIRPSSEPCEEMTLRESVEVIGADIFNTPCIHDAGRDEPGIN
jgi:hypothetical protein